MTDDERDELLRWAAEEVLGWVYGGNSTAGLYWLGHDEPELLGWVGFGRGVEAARERGLQIEVRIGPIKSSYGSEGAVMVLMRGRRCRKVSHDPALAAWAALREALVAVPG